MSATVQRYERIAAAAIKAADTLPLDAGQRDRFELAKKVAAETGCAVVTALPIINGRHHARCGLPPVVRLERDCGYSHGYEAPR